MPKKPKAQKNELPVQSIRNSLADIMGGGWEGFGQFFGTQVNQLDTIFKNNRGNYISNQRFELSQFYAQHGIVQTVIDVPVDDALRGGLEIKTKQLEPEQLEQLHYKMEEQNDLNVLGEATAWKRLFGGGAIIIESGQRKDQPFNIDRMKKGYPLSFRAADMWELPIAGYKASSGPDMARGYLESATAFNYYGDTLDRSHVLPLKGLRAPSLIRPRFLGWGMSVIEGMVDAINQYLRENNLIFEVLNEFKIDYYKIKNFNTDVLNPGGQQALMERLMLMNRAKSFQNASVMDSEDDFIQKQLSFTGLGEVSVGIRMKIASALKMPLSKIFGISSQGFSSGEDDLENYNGMVESTVRSKIRQAALFMTQLRCAQEFGYVPDDLRIGFKPLRVLTSEQQETVKTEQFTRVFQAKSAGELTTEEFRNALNKDELLPIQLDKDIDESELSIGDESEEGSAEGNGASSDKKSVTQAPEAKS